jgi:tripartite-type tricarboxylate transporter receptor subunit TctC
MLCLGTLQAAWADYPDQRITLIVPYSAGGNADVLGRTLAQKLSERLGVTVIVENKPGASTLIGAQYVAKAVPDGYTILLGATSMALLPLRKQGTTVDMRKDLAPVSAFAKSAYVILANEHAPFNTLPEMIEYAKANPGTVNYANNGSGSSTHLVGEYLSSAAGIKMVAIPYKGGSAPQTIALLGGEIQVSIDGMGQTNQYIQDGKIKLLATTGKSRSKVFPNAPTVAETVPGFVAEGYYGLLTVPGTPKEAIETLHAAIVAIMADPQVRERVASLSLDAVNTTPAEYQKLTEDDVERWGRVVQERGLVIE